MASPTTSPSPRLILSALRAHLLPHPILPLLPTTLQLFAHLQLLSNKLRLEAGRAIKMSGQLILQLEEDGLDDTEIVRQGALSKREGTVLQKIAGVETGEREGRMIAFSMEFRKFHLAKMLSRPKLDPRRVRGMIDTYFPEWPSSSSSSSSLHRPQATPHQLYIRVLDKGDAMILTRYRMEVLEWYMRAQLLFNASQPSPALTDFYPRINDEGTKKLESLANNLIKEAESVVRDVQAFQAIFGVRPDDEKLYDENEEEEEVSDDDDQIAEGQGDGSTLGLRQDRTDNRLYETQPRNAQAGPSHLHLRLPATNTAYAVERNKPKRLSSPLQERAWDTSASSPSMHQPPQAPNRQAHPSRSVSSHRNHSTAQKETAREPLFISSDSGSEEEEETTLPRPIRHREVPLDLATGALREPVQRGIPPDEVTSFVVPSPRPKKRPRQSDPLSASTFTSASTSAFGPDFDFTAKEKAFGENLRGQKLRPFSNAELYKHKRARASIV